MKEYPTLVLYLETVRSRDRLIEKPHLLGMTSSELEELAESLGEPKFRGRQIAKWLYKHNATSLDEMTDLPLSLRERLKEAAVLYRARIVNRSVSRDGTTKLLLELEDGQTIESVLIPYEDRVSVCVSTQVGCVVRCIFCATGISGFARNLTAGEIVDEVLTCQKETPRRVSHVVYMGMGEPLLNHENVLKSIQILNKEVGISMRHITISTIGITPQIRRLAEEKLQLTLAVSLHAPDDMLRRQIIPFAARYPLQDLIEACKEYAETTGRRITFEYLLIRNINDSISHARKLANLLKGILCNVNLIPYNAVEGLELDRPSQARVRAFRSVLEESGITVTQRVERGHAISAACGQLRRRSQLPN
ncbi:MAG: 23S rRNA (adenine(2503)-C(2))-methyltransferase RlmN [Armatimonadota bacterium]|nr:23S rRNA (adenine(2503)-C(2))-methyltransferase RlmN [Armatimonadota bacterium]